MLGVVAFGCATKPKEEVEEHNYVQDAGVDVGFHRNRNLSDTERSAVLNRAQTLRLGMSIEEVEAIVGEISTVPNGPSLREALREWPSGMSLMVAGTDGVCAYVFANNGKTIYKLKRWYPLNE